MRLQGKMFIKRKQYSSLNNIRIFNSKAKVQMVTSVTNKIKQN